MCLVVSAGRGGPGLYGAHQGGCAWHMDVLAHSDYVIHCNQALALTPSSPVTSAYLSHFHRTCPCLFALRVASALHVASA